VSNPWAPEREITVTEARTAVRSTGYAGEAETVEIIAAGWDNTIVLVDDEWVFRFPRREIALPGIHREIAWLPVLAGRLPVPIPVPVRVGTFGAPPWPFWGGRHLPGVELAHSPHADRTRVAVTIGRLLADLHALETIDELPIDPFGRADSASRAPRARAVLADLRDLGLWRDDPAIDVVLDAGGALGPPTARPVLSHGDLYSRHVLIGDDGAVTGIIDWGDLCLAPAAVDLAIAFSAFRGESRLAILEAYGPVDDDALLRAQTFAVFSAASVAHYAYDVGDDVLLAEALTGLDGITD
jgi:aminoglycoside phosphotransferase (APT) family kinase protein